MAGAARAGVAAANIGSKIGKVASVARKASAVANVAKGVIGGVRNAADGADRTYKNATGRHLESIEKKADDIMQSAIDKVNKK